MRLVAGIDSSTQSCKVVIREAESGKLVRYGQAPHEPGTEIDPEHWWIALQAAASAAGGLDDVDAISVGGQQHGMVCLDQGGNVVRPAMLWNDTQSAGAAAELTKELGDGDADAGARAWADAVGSVLVASFTVTKLRWLAENEPENATLTAAVCLPHDWLTWRLAGFGPGVPDGIDNLTTDASDASGTGYFSAATGDWRHDLLERALGHDAVVPRVLGPHESEFTTPEGARLGVGAGDNAAAALGLHAEPGEIVVSIGTSGTIFAVSDASTSDPSGSIAGFATADGRHLPLVCTLNASRVPDTYAKMLGVKAAAFSELALAADAGAGGLTLVPYLEGERTPNLPGASGAMHGITTQNFTQENLARAAVEGMLCGLADGADALTDAGIVGDRIVMIGGGARSAAVQQIAPAIFGRPVTVPRPDEYVADGMARQAARVLLGHAPLWQKSPSKEFHADAPHHDVRDKYAAVKALLLEDGSA